MSAHHVMDRIAVFLGQLLDRHNRSDERQHAMSADLKTIIDKLNDQGAKIASQGRQIDKLIADRDAKEQADLDRIMSLIESNGSASAANAAKLAGALAPSDAEAPSAPVSVTVAAPVTAPSTTIPVAPGVIDASAVGSAVSGPGIADGTVVAPGTTDGQLVLDTPTEADHSGSEVLTVTPPAQ